MLSVLIISLIAGVCHGQNEGLFSECDDQQTIISQCSDTHLVYLKKIDAGEVITMQRVSEIDDPAFLLDSVKLNSICNDTNHLQLYYQCVHANLTTCLQTVNSTKAKDLADADTISQGIVNMCKSRNELNKTCLAEKATDVKTCFATFISESDKASDQCTTYEVLIRCTEKQSVCEGGEVVKDFVVSARPNGCRDTSTAVPRMASVSVVLLLASLGQLVAFHL